MDSRFISERDIGGQWHQRKMLQQEKKMERDFHSIRLPKQCEYFLANESRTDIGSTCKWKWDLFIANFSLFHFHFISFLWRMGDDVVPWLVQQRVDWSPLAGVEADPMRGRIPSVLHRQQESLRRLQIRWQGRLSSEFERKARKLA